MESRDSLRKNTRRARLLADFSTDLRVRCIFFFNLLMYCIKPRCLWGAVVFIFPNLLFRAGMYYSDEPDVFIQTAETF